MSKYLTDAGRAFFRGDYEKMGELLNKYAMARQEGGSPPKLKLDGQWVNGDSLFTVLSDIHVTL